MDAGGEAGAPVSKATSSGDTTQQQETAQATYENGGTEAGATASDDIASGTASTKPQKAGENINGDVDVVVASADKNVPADDVEDAVNCSACCNINVFFYVVICVTSLVEDYAALYLQPDDSPFPESTIFWAFFGFAIAPGLLLCCCHDSLSFEITLEMGQAALFTYFAGTTKTAIVVFAGFLIFQSNMISLSRCKCCRKDDEHQDIQNDESGGAIKGCCSLLFNTACFMPFIYFREDSPFRQQTFDIALTFLIWMGDFLDSFMVRVTHVKGCGSKCFRAFGVFKTSFSLLKFAFVAVLCVEYSTTMGPEEWEQLWMVIFLGFAVLAVGCLVWSIWSFFCYKYMWATDEEKDEMTEEEKAPCGMSLLFRCCFRCCFNCYVPDESKGQIRDIMGTPDDIYDDIISMKNVKPAPVDDINQAMGQAQQEVVQNEMTALDQQTK